MVIFTIRGGIGALLLVVVTSCSPRDVRKIDDPSSARAREERLVMLFRHLPAWRQSRGLAASEWQDLERAAVVVQQSPYRDVTAALDRFVCEIQNSNLRSDYEEESKVFLLLRFVFNLPEKAREADRVSFKGWNNWPVVQDGEAVNLSWPIIWQDGKPSLAARYEGSQGKPYAASAEFRHFLEHYAFRGVGDQKGRQPARKGGCATH